MKKTILFHLEIQIYKDYLMHALMIFLKYWTILIFLVIKYRWLMAEKREKN